MIDLMNNDKIPAPVSSDVMVEMLSEMAIYDGESPILTLSALISEVKMWRAKDEFERKRKAIMGSAIIKNLENHGFKVDGEIQ